MELCTYHNSCLHLLKGKRQGWASPGQEASQFLEALEVSCKQMSSSCLSALQPWLFLTVRVPQMYLLPRLGNCTCSLGCGNFLVRLSLQLRPCSATDRRFCKSEFCTLHAPHGAHNHVPQLRDLGSTVCELPDSNRGSPELKSVAFPTRPSSLMQLPSSYTALIGTQKQHRCKQGSKANL